jgi:hypothetical protein
MDSCLRPGNMQRFCFRVHCSTLNIKPPTGSRCPSTCSNANECDTICHYRDVALFTSIPSAVRPRLSLLLSRRRYKALSSLYVRIANQNSVSCPPCKPELWQSLSFSPNAVPNYVPLTELLRGHYIALQPLFRLVNYSSRSPGLIVITCLRVEIN